MRYRSIKVGGLDRGYWVAGLPADHRRPMLVVLHGLGINGQVMARWTGLAARGPAAGFVTVFPEGLGEAWDDAGRGRVDGADDGAFVAALIGELVDEGAADPSQVVLVGLSNGASFAERLGRQGRVRALGLALVAGTAREASRRAATRPSQRAGLLLIVGTADPNLPYGGGRARGVTGWIARRRMKSRLLQPDGRESVAPEVVAADWAEANGCRSEPLLERLEQPAGELPVVKVTWAGCDPPVELYRIEGGGHGWPGGPQYAPRPLIGRVSRTFDATAVVLDFATRLAQSAAE